MSRFSIKETNIFYIFFMLMYVGMSIVAGSLLPANAPEWLARCVSTAIIVLPLILLLVAKKIHPREFLGQSKLKITDLILAYIAAYCLMPTIYFINYITMFFARNYVNGMMSQVYEYPLAIQLLLIAFMPAVAEEFIFRGFFYGSYRRKSVIGGALMSGLVFGLAHLNLNQFAYAFVIGAAFSILYEAADNILIPVTAHFAINANTVFLMQAADINVEQLAETSSADVGGAIPAGVIVIMLAVIFGMGILGLTLFGAIVRNIAGRHGRRELFWNSLKNWKDDMKPANGRYLDVYMVTAVVAAGLYMILLEFMH